MITAFILTIFLTIMLIPLISVKWKGIVTVTTVVVLAVLSSMIAVEANFRKTNVEYSFRGSLVTGEIPVRMDALSGFFILVINFTIPHRRFLWLAVYEGLPESKG